MQTNHYMQKKGGLIIKVNLNEWTRHRRSGYEFRTELEYNNQEAEKVELAAEVQEKTTELTDVRPTLESTLDEIFAFAELNNIDVDEGSTNKVELLEVIYAALP